MKIHYTDILVFTILTLIAITILFLTAGQSTIDIQLHDTYYILNKTQLVILTIGPLTFLTFLTLGLIRKFKTIGTNLGLVVGLILISLIIYRVIEFQISYRDQIKNDDELQVTNKGQVIKDMNKEINWTWGLFGFCIIGIGLTGLRTYKLLR